MADFIEHPGFEDQHFDVNEERFRAAILLMKRIRRLERLLARRRGGFLVAPDELWGGTLKFRKDQDKAREKVNRMIARTDQLISTNAPLQN